MRRCMAGLAVAAVLVLLGGDRLWAQAGGSAGWMTSYPKALEAAKANKRVVLADFTGSDWCGFCIKLKKEVLDTPDFKQWAAKDLVLLELDYPRQKAQSAELKKQNAELKAKFKVSGFPTVVFLDGEGNELGRIVGYSGKEEWAKKAQEIVKKAKG